MEKQERFLNFNVTMFPFLDVRESRRLDESKSFFFTSHSRYILSLKKL